MQLAEVQKLVDTAQQMVGRYVVIEVEGVEQRCLRNLLTTHHRGNVHLIDGSAVNQLQTAGSTDFFNTIDPRRTVRN